MSHFVNEMRQASESLHKLKQNLHPDGPGRSFARHRVDALIDELEGFSRRPPMPKSVDCDHLGQPLELSDQVEGRSNNFERIIDESNLLPVSFLERGVEVQKAVGRVVLTQPHSVDGFTFPAGTGWGTGFLVGPDLFLTNNHVIPDADFAGRVRMQFNFQLNGEGFEQVSDSYLPSTDGFLHTHRSLDYSLIRLRSKMVANDPAFLSQVIVPGQLWGHVPLNPAPSFRAGQHFNIIQHPSGRHKEVSLQENEISELFSDVVRYTSDTEPGSSGSPVFDNLWQLVALHHAGGEKVDNRFINNEGIRCDRIVEDLRDAFGATASNHRLLDELGI